MVETKRTIVISGYYGFGNSGDEAVLQAIVNALRIQSEQFDQKLRIIVLSANPEHTRKQYGVEAVQRMSISQIWKALRQADALISGGGSLLQDATSWRTIPYYLSVIKMAQIQSVPVFIYAQGIGPVHSPRYSRWISAIFKKTAGISVRDPQSAAFLKKIGISEQRIIQVPDPVMGLFSERSATRPPRAGTFETVGVAVRKWHSTYRELREIGKALALISSEREIQVKMLPFHQPEDEAASAIVLEAMKEFGASNVPIEWVTGAGDDPLKMMDEVQLCDVLIGMRLHALIYSATRFVPSVAISYDPKIDQFMQQINEQAVGNTDRVMAEQIAERALELLDQGPFWLMERRTQIEALQQAAHQPAAMIFESFNGMRKAGETYNV